MYDRILLATDGSPAMGSTVDQALGQAAQSGATLHALYVVDVRAYLMLPEDTGGRVAELLEADGRDALESLRELADDRGLECVTDLAVGVPHQAILDYVDEHDVDLVVMGTHGRTGEEKRVVGSVAEEVVRQSRVPVLTVRMSEVDRRELSEAVPEEQQRYIR